MTGMARMAAGGSDYDRFPRKLLLGSASTGIIPRKFHLDMDMPPGVGLNPCQT